MGARKVLQPNRPRWSAFVREQIGEQSIGLVATAWGLQLGRVRAWLSGRASPPLTQVAALACAMGVSEQAILWNLGIETMQTADQARRYRSRQPISRKGMLMKLPQALRKQRRRNKERGYKRKHGLSRSQWRAIWAVICHNRRIRSGGVRVTSDGRERLRNINRGARRRGWTGPLIQWGSFILLLDSEPTTCPCCGAVEKLTVDHVVALAAGGAHCASNLGWLCHSCNSAKGRGSSRGGWPLSGVSGIPPTISHTFFLSNQVIRL